MEDVQRPPEGTIALLFTDIEGSTRLAAKLGPAWESVLAAHHALVGDAIAAEGGFVDGIEGDSFFATFAEAPAAARAATRAQRALRTHPWPAQVGEVRVRMGLHVGYVARSATRYVGLEVHRAARVAAAGHGGQLLMTAAAHALIGDVVPTEALGTHRLKDFPTPESLFCAVIDGRGAAAFPPPRTEEVRPTNLPAGRPKLVGRADDLERVRTALLADGERLVTLTGRGGAGKTSLALAAGAALLDEHAGGVWLTRLATVDSPGDVLPAIAVTLGAERDVSRTPHEAITARLRDRGPTLLILDNFEHVLAAAPEVPALLDALPELRLLITSQAPLRLAAERLFPLDALDDEAALALIERVARRRGATVSADGADREALLDIVHLLDGLPLALELAAPRLAVLTTAQLADRLRESPDVLRDAGADRPQRHCSLRATVEWTLSMLDDAPRELFARMGAFARPVEVEDLEAVTGGDGLDVLEALAGLLDVALVRRVEAGDCRMRFGLPEALRQIAARMLDASPDGQTWRRAHAQRQKDIAWAARALGQSAGDPYRAALAADAEAAAALRWARAGGDPLAAPLGAARGALLADNGRAREAFALLEPMLEAPSGDPTVDGLTLMAYAYTLRNVGRLQDAVAYADRALAIVEDPTVRAKTLIVRALAHTFAEEHEAAVRDSEEATALARDLGPAFLSGALALEAQARMFAGDVELAAQQHAEAARIGAPVDTVSLWNRDTFHGDLAMRSGRPRDALEHFARSIEVAQAAGNEFQVLMDLQGVAHALAVLGQDAEALEVVGLAEAQGADVGGSDSSGVAQIPCRDELADAEERLGPAAAELKARGRAVPCADRVARACRLARAQQPV